MISYNTTLKQNAGELDCISTIVILCSLQIAQLLMNLDLSTQAGYMYVQQISKHLISSGCPGQDFDVFVTKICEFLRSSLIYRPI